MYAFTRHLIATALAPEGDWAFAWWVDQDLRVNSEAQGDIPQSDQSCNVLGLWAAKGDDAGRITDLWFFRQLTLPERALRFNDPAMPFQSLDTAAFKEPSELKEDPARARAMMDAARQFDGMYAAGNTVAAAELLADNVVSYDLLFGSSSNSREEWVAKHDKLFAVRRFQQGRLVVSNTSVDRAKSTIRSCTLPQSPPAPTATRRLSTGMPVAVDGAGQ